MVLAPVWLSCGVHGGPGLLNGKQVLLSGGNPSRATASELATEKADKGTDFFSSKKNSSYHIFNSQLCSNFTRSTYQLSNFLIDQTLPLLCQTACVFIAM